MSDSRYLQRILSEGTVIVVSILLAFWIDAAWETRQARQTEATVLESLREEAEENRRDLAELRERNQEQDVRMQLFLSMSDAELRDLPQDSVNPWLSAMVITWTFDADNSAAGLFLDSSAPVTDRARSVRGVLAEWVRAVDDLEEEKRSFWDLGIELAQRLAELSVTVEAGDQALLQEVAAQLGPPLLADLRADQRFVALLLNKAHYQRVYTNELEEATATLADLQTLLEEGTE